MHRSTLDDRAHHLINTVLSAEYEYLDVKVSVSGGISCTGAKIRYISFNQSVMIEDLNRWKSAVGETR